MIRPASYADIPRMLELGRAMHAESTKFRGFAWSDEKTGRLLAWLIENDDGFAVVAEHDGMVIGGFMGMVLEQFFSYDRVAQDFALFVSPDRRGAFIGKQLVEAFKVWGKGKNVPVEIGVSTKVHAEATCKLLEACGFERYGFLYQLKEG